MLKNAGQLVFTHPKWAFLPIHFVYLYCFLYGMGIYNETDLAHN